MHSLHKKIASYGLLICLSLLTACSSNQTHDSTTRYINNASSQHTENQDWPSFGRDYANKRFSENKQINAANIKN